MSIKRHPLNQSRLFKVKSPKQLANILGITFDDFVSIETMQRPYNERTIQTGSDKKPKIREIQEPNGLLKHVHRKVSEILAKIEPPPFLFCPVKGRSYVSNAISHIGSHQVRTIDIKNYFPSTKHYHVYRFFHHIMKCAKDVSFRLSRILTVDGHLATGSPVSPILSFYAFFEMWTQIAEMATNCGCRLTVYVDDVTISGRSVPSWLIWNIKKKIHAAELSYHKEKTFTRGISEITGVIISTSKAALPNRQHQKAHQLRQRLTEETDDDARTKIRLQLQGLKAQKEQVERKS